MIGDCFDKKRAEVILLRDRKEFAAKIKRARKEFGESGCTKPAENYFDGD